MKIQFTNLLQNYSINSVKNSTPLKNNSVSLPALQNDMFVKSTNSVSFKGSSDNDVSVADALITAGVVGGPLLLAIASTDYLAKNDNPKELFTQDGYYIGNVDDFKTETDKVLIDKMTGEINFKGTGLHIDPSNYDYVDPANGIYRNYDGSADINLSENKFIDKNMGIIVDPESKISAFRNADGLYEYKDLPSFGGSSYHESTGSAYWNRFDVQSRQEFIDKYGETPEDFFNNDPDLMNTYLGSWVINPNDYRSALQKVEDFFTGKNDIVYDAWGRRLFVKQNENGTTTTYAMDEDAMKFAQEHNMTDEQISKVVEFADQVRLQEYFTENHPELMIEKSIIRALDFAGRIRRSTDNSDIETNEIADQIDVDNNIDLPDDNSDDSMLERLLKIFVHSNSED